MEKRFDERQQFVRGKIFKHALFSIIFLLFAEAFLQEFFGITYFEGMWSNFSVIMIAAAVMTTEMIWKDAYPMSEKKQIMFFCAIGAGGLFLLVMFISEAGGGISLLAANALSENAAYLFLGLMYLCLSVVYFIKLILNKNKKEEV